MRGHAAVDEHYHNSLGPVEGIAIAAHNLGVELRETLDGRGIGNGDKRDRLTSHAARRVLACLDNACEFFCLDGAIAVVAAATAMDERFDGLHGFS